MSLISINNLTKIYPPDFHALSSITFSVKDGEKLAILGPSGSGKSTLLKLISGIEKQTKGEILINGYEANNLSRRGDIGFVFQDENSIFPHLTVFENIAFPLKLSLRKSQFDINKDVNEILQIVGLNLLKDKYPKTLSGGEKQRVAIARALIYNPKVLLLDEPLSSLDNILKREILDLIHKIHFEYKKTILYVTHDEREAFEISDKVIILNKGQLLQYGNLEEIVNSPQNAIVAKIIGNWNIIPGYLRKNGKSSFYEIIDKNIPINLFNSISEDYVEIGIPYSSFKIVNNDFENISNGNISFKGTVSNIHKTNNGYIITIIYNNFSLKCEIKNLPYHLSVNKAVSLGINIKQCKIWN